MRSAGLHLPRARRRWFFTLFGTVTTLCSCLIWTSASHALTQSIGEPWNGRLVNGIVFPTDMGGYKVRDPDLAYATPELIGSLLEAIEAVRDKYPNTVDLFIGDFSAPGGGRLKGHKSHQNGRDVDLGMYAIGNEPLDRFIPMHAGNLDVPKTWCLIEALIRTGRVQYLFVDRKIQRMLFEFALSRGFDESLLNRLFNDVGSGSSEAAIRHEPLHNDHIHVRFDAPWSTLAAQAGSLDPEKKALIELAQAGFLPKRVLYYVDKRATDLGALAMSFGVRVEDLARWNHLNPNAPLIPGTPLVYYRRAFELEPVHLAESLRLRTLIPLEPVQVASVASLPPVDVSSWLRAAEAAPKVEKKVERVHAVQRHETLESIARKYGLSATQLARMNNISSKKPLRAGSKLVVGYSTPKSSPGEKRESGFQPMPTAPLKNAPPSAVFSDKPEPQTALTHVVKKGDTLSAIAKKYRVSESDLRTWNKLSTKETLSNGRTLVVAPPRQEPPSASQTKSSGGGVTRRETPKAQTATSPPSVSKGSSGQKSPSTVHTVSPGENLFSISRKYKVDAEKIRTANQIDDPKKIKPGVRLKIPLAQS